ncbi:MAG: alpha/beta hydrolase, partial [Oscillospiraceae bacterium]|nr:alpha/beta hydrolase [Oscillospiraceae bacterium]
MADKTLKYRALLRAFRILPVRQIMASPTERTQRIFRLAYKGENIPKLQDDALEIKRLRIAGSSVLYYRHRKQTDRLAIYLVGGGMLKFPQPSQAQALVGFAKQCHTDILLPYYPIIFTGGTLPDVYAMLYALYQQALRRYKPAH